MSNEYMPAFPQSIDDGQSKTYYFGMTLRDYFAAKAMQALIALWWKDLNNAEGSNFHGLNLIDNGGGTPSGIANESFAIADAMLEAGKE